MTFFPDYAAALAHSEGLRQGDVRAARVDHAATHAAIADGSRNHADALRQGPVSAVAHDTHRAAISLAEQRHRDRLAAAGVAFGVTNSTPGNPRAEHAQRWLRDGAAD